MALILLQPDIQPIGQYDSVDGYTALVKGGEVCTFTSVTVASDSAAADALDGYLNPGTSRAALTVNLTATSAPLFLVDDGLKNYGTIFGTVVGGTVGQVSFGPGSSIPAADLLGPHTALGSGKWTAWQANGLYGVTLDAMDPSASTGVQPTNSACVPGLALYAAIGAQTTIPAGQLTTTSGPTHTTGVVARFIEFHTNGALVSTPNRLVSALNSPSSTVGGVLSNSLFMCVVNFQPGL